MIDRSDVEFLADSEEHGQYFEEVEKIVAGVVEDKRAGKYKDEGRVETAIRDAAMQSKYFRNPELCPLTLKYSDYPCAGFLPNGGVTRKHKATDAFPLNWMAYYALAADCIERYRELLATRDVKPIGQFIVLEGVDASGKTTQLKLLRQNLENCFPGVEIVDCHAPGGTEFGNKVRGVLLDKTGGARSPLAEALLFLASLDSLLCEVIRPALGRGAIVISSRYILSTLIYQGIASRLGKDTVAELASYVLEDVVPDLTLILDVCVATMKTRLNGQQDRIESRGDEYFREIRHNYLSAIDDPGRVKVFPEYASKKTVGIHASDPVYIVSKVILEHVCPLLTAAGFPTYGDAANEHASHKTV